MIDVLHGPAWTAAIFAASIGLFLVPAAQWLAQSTGFVAVPRVATHRRIAYLGGPAVAISVLIGSHVARVQNDHVALALGLASALGVVGLIDDHRTIPATIRFAVELAAAGSLVVVAGGLPLTGSTHVDAVLTVLWIVAVVNGVNFLDNSDALASCVVGLVATGFIVAAGPRTSVGVTAAAIAGGCCAFLAFNARPAAIYLGDAGSMFLGFLLPSLALELARQSSHPMTTAWTVSGLLALPLIELSVTVFRRISHGRPFWLSAPDNLSYALAARTRPGIAWFTHLIAQLLLTGAAVLAFRDAVPSGVVAGVGVAELACLAIATRGAPVHDPDERASRGVRIVIGVLIGVVVLLVLTSIAGAALALHSAEEGARDLDRATTYLRRGDTARARAAFLTAEQHFGAAHRVLHSVPVAGTRLVPIVGRNVTAMADMVDFGVALSHDGARFTGTVDASALHLRGGHVPIAEVRADAPALDALARSVAVIDHRARGMDDRMLLPPVARKVAELRDRLDRAAVDTGNAAAAAAIVPGVFGDDATRHYLVIAQNPAEARATGGIPGSFGYLDAASGRLELRELTPVETLDELAAAQPTSESPGPPDYNSRYARFDPQRWWENVPMSPDFPTVASVLARQYERDTQRPVDGVISLDPIALRALLHLTGPVRVDSWPVPISETNVVDVTMRDEYTHFTDNRTRKEFLGSVTKAVWNAMRGRDLGSPSQLANTLGKAAAQRHLLMWLSRPDEQRVLRRLGLDGGVPEPTADAFFTTIQNGAGTKLDVYMSRRWSYDVTVQPSDDHHAKIEAAATLAIGNHAPAGLPKFVEGTYAQYTPGELRSYLSVYSALALVDASLNRRRAIFESDREFGRSVYSTFVSVPRGEVARFALRFSGVVDTQDGWYTLRLFPQPGIAGESVNVVVRAPAGYEIVRADGCRIQRRSACVLSGPLSEPSNIRVAIRTS